MFDYSILVIGISNKVIQPFINQQMPSALEQHTDPTVGSYDSINPVLFSKNALYVL